MTPKDKPIGLTRDSGYQVGARKSFPVAFEKAWDFLFSERGIEIWLGKTDPDNLEEGLPFTTQEGHEVEVRLFKPGSHIRLSYKPRDWKNTSLLQVRLIPNKEKTSISFHQDQMLNEQQREEMKRHWKMVLEKLSKQLSR